MLSFVMKYRWALAGTILLHLSITLYMQQKKFPTPYVPLTRLEEIPVLMEDEPEQKIEIKTEEENLMNESGKVSNITANEADKVGATDKKYDSRSFKNLDADVEKELREYEKNAFNEFAANHKHTVNTNDEDPVKKKNDTKKTEGATSSNDETGKVRNVGRVAASYDLDGRADEYFAKPAYVCKGSGKIVLNVKVNQNGKVTSATINTSASSFTEECMGENAVKYALKCKFEAGTNWPEPQSGTITYTYISQ